MCTVSMIGDQWQRDFAPRFPQKPPYDPIDLTDYKLPEISRAEFEELKEEMRELKKLLLAAKEYDEKTGQPDCEADDKVALIKAVAEAVGVDFDSVFEVKQE